MITAISGVRPLYESRVREFAVQSFPESGIKVFSDIRNLGQGTDGQSVTEENVLQTASAVTYIFISESVCTEAQLRILQKSVRSGWKASARVWRHRSV